MIKNIDLGGEEFVYREDLSCPIGQLRFFDSIDSVYDVELNSDIVNFWGKTIKSGFYYDIIDHLEEIKSLERIVPYTEWIDNLDIKCSLEGFKKEKEVFIVYKQKGFYFIYSSND